MMGCAIKSKRPGMLTDGIILLHDNARPHTASLVRDKFQRFVWETLEHPSYSPDLTNIGEVWFVSWCLRVLRRAIESKSPGMPSDGIILLHGNARPHTTNLVRDKLQRFVWETLQNPPYSPDRYQHWRGVVSFLVAEGAATRHKIKTPWNAVGRNHSFA